MYKYSRRSLDRLSTCDDRLQDVFKEVIKYVDCTIIEGVRTIEQQKEYVRRGVSKTMRSKHLPGPDGLSRAVDVAPYPIDWKNKERFYLFVGFVKGIAASKGIKLRVGADWDGDFTTRDQSFHDLPHFELVD